MYCVHFQPVETERVMKVLITSRNGDIVQSMMKYLKRNRIYFRDVILFESEYDVNNDDYSRAAAS